MRTQRPGLKNGSFAFSQIPIANLSSKQGEFIQGDYYKGEKRRPISCPEDLPANRETTYRRSINLKQ